MNHYETVTLLVPEFSDKDIQKYIDELRALLTQHGAVDLAPPRVDRRPLAYPIGKSTEGYYVYLQCDAPPTLPEVIRTEFKHREGILRLAFIRRPKVAPETENAERPAPKPVSEDGPDDGPDASNDEATDSPAPAVVAEEPDANAVAEATDSPAPTAAAEEPDADAVTEDDAAPERDDG